MSEIPRWLALEFEIQAIDAAVEDYCLGWRTDFCSWFTRGWWAGLLTGYRTGKIPPKALPSAFAPVEVPMEVIEKLYAQVSATTSAPEIEIPDEILFPKRKRGRPAHQMTREAVSHLRCSSRHALRLIAAQKPRQRNRPEPEPDPITAWILERRERRLVLEKALQIEELIRTLAFGIEAQNRRNQSPEFEPSRSGARALVEVWVKEVGLEGAAVIGAYAGGTDAFYASSALGVSSSTVRRRCGDRFAEFKHRGETLQGQLPGADLANLLLKKPNAPPRCVEDEGDAWTEQTVWMPRPERRRSYSH